MPSITFRSALATTIAAFFATSPAASARPSIKISVAGVANGEGYLMAALYDKAGWRGSALDRARIEARKGTTTLSLEAPAPGTYGVKLFHDTNGNGKLDTNLVGLPVEPVGFSNDAPLRFGPPDFDDAAFEVGATGAELTISLR